MNESELIGGAIETDRKVKLIQLAEDVTALLMIAGVVVFFLWLASIGAL